MSTKRLKMGQKKCFQIHVGKKAPQLCPQLSVHDETMKTTSSETYIGDIFLNDAKIDLNIHARYEKSIEVINTIFSSFQEISFGEYYFEMAMVFRSSMLISSILCISEVLYGLKSKYLQVLEKCDKLFFSKPNSCAHESYFLETNTQPIRFILIGCRIIYYWSLLNNPK